MGGGRDNFENILHVKADQFWKYRPKKWSANFGTID